MGIQNRDGALYFSTGIDNTGLYSGRKEAIGIIKAMAGEITSFDVFGGIGISAGIAFAQAAKGAYDFEKQFQQSMKEVATISNGIKGSLTEYMNSVVDITRTIPVYATDAAKALYQIVSAGHDGADGMKILEISAKAAIGGVTDTATSADAITTILNAYKKSASEAERISDMLFTTARLGKTTMGELGKSIAQAAPIAASYGVDIEQLLAAVATLTKQGTPTAQAMTQIRASIIAVSKELGDGAFDTMTYQEALAEVARRANGSEAELRRLVPEVEAVNAVLGLTGINVQEAAVHLGEMQNATGAAEAAFKEMSTSAENQLKLLGNNITAVLRPLGEELLQKVSSIATTFNKAFESGDVQQSMQTLGGLIITVTSAMIGYKGAMIAANTVKKINASLLEMERYEMVLYRKAVEAGTISENVLTSAQVKNMATRKAMIATIKLHTATLGRNIAALATNPYILAAAAVAGLGYAVYKCATAETAAEIVQKKYNKAVEEQTRLLDELKNKTNSLVSIVKDENSTQYDKVKAYKQLQALMPTVFANMDIETLKLMDHLSLNKQINNEINRRERIGAQTNVILAQKEVDRINSLISKDLAYSGQYEIQLTDAKENLEVAKKVYSEIEKIQTEANKPKELKIVSLQSNIDTLKTEISELQSLVEKEQEENNGWSPNAWLLKAKKGQLSTKEKEMKSLQGSGGSNNEVANKADEAYWTKQKEESDKALKALSDVEAAGKKGMELKKKIAKINEKLEIYSTNTSKQESATKKLREEQEKRNEELLTLQKNNQKSEVDLLEEGSEKKIAQIELDYKNEIAAIRKQEEEWTKAEGGKLTKKQSQEISIAYTYAEDKKDKGISDVKEETLKEERERLEAAQSAWNEYNKAYGTWKEKRIAIDKEYQQKISNIQNDKNKSDDEKNTLIATSRKEWEESIANLNLDKLKQDINWEVVFGDMSKVAKKQLQEVKKQITEFKKSPEFKNSSPETIKVIEEALNNIDNALVDKGGFFGGLSDSLEDYKTKLEEAKKAQEEYDAALKTGNEVLIEKAKEKRNATNANVTNSGTTLEKSKDKAVSNINAVSNAIVQLGKKDVSLADIGNTVSALVDTLGKSGNMIGGIISAILSIIDAAGDVGTFQYGIDLVENVSSKVTDAFAKDTESITGLDMSFMKSADYDDYNELVEQYDTLMDVWDQLLDKKKAYIKESYGGEAAKAGQEALDLLNSEKKITKELASSRLDAGESAGSHSMNYRMWKGSYDYNGTNWKDVAGDISKSLGGVDFSSMWSMLDMSAEQLEWIKTNYSGLWAHMDGDFKGYLDDIIKYGDTEKEIIESINEQLTQTSFDSLFDSFLNTLMDMDASSQDFANNFEEYMRKAIFTSMFAKNYEKDLENWYKDFAKANDKEGGITEDDVESLKTKWDGIVNGALSDREAWEKIVGSSNSSSSSQSSTQKSFEAMSQDTGDELNGRFTALQISNEEIKNQSIIQTGIQQGIAQKLDFLYNFNYTTFTEMRDMMWNVLDTVLDIKKDTAHLYFIRESLNKIDNNTKGLVSK